VNDQNVLVEAHNPDQISGLIDFGELQYVSRFSINDGLPFTIFDGHEERKAII
jgi:hypothetical protein